MPGGLHPPISVIASWPRANLRDPSVRSDTFSIVIIFFLVLSGLTVGARLWARGVIQRNFAPEDYMIIGAFLCALAMASASVLAMARYAFDRHVWDAFYLVDKLENGRKTVLAMECAYILGTGLIKISILCFVLRMTRRGSNRWVFYTVWCTMIFCGLTTVIFFILSLAECRPFAAFWHQVNYKWILADVKHECLDEGARVIAAGTFAVIQDIIVASLPLSTVWGLGMPIKQKIIVTTIFGGGYLTCAFGAMRLVYSYRTFYQTYDVTWAAPHIFLWTNLELQFALIFASIPALKVFFKHYKPSTSRSKLSYAMDRYNISCSKSPGLYTEQLRSDTNHDDHATGDKDIRVHDTIAVTSEHGSSQRKPALEWSPV